MEHFIPLRRTDVTAWCASELAAGVGSDQAAGQTEQRFIQVASRLTALLHIDGHRRLEQLKDAYAPVNPDRDTLVVNDWHADQLNALKSTFTETLKLTIQAANFSPITETDLQESLQEQSLFKVRLAVDFDDFEEVLFYRRGESIQQRTVASWWGLVKRDIQFTHYDRVVVYVRFRDDKIPLEAATEASAASPQAQWKKGTVMLKLFQNVPKGDLEMLFPNTEVRMKTIDKLLIGIPAAVSGVIVASTKLGTTLLLIGALLGFWLGLRQHPVVLDQAAMVAVAGGLGALGAYVWKQFSNFKNRKIRFMKALADSLYFKNLDNNVGVFHRLIDAAEEEECKEALLAYAYLLMHGPKTEEQLDAGVEQWLTERYGVKFNFEIGDAVQKLIRFELITAQRTDAPNSTSIAAVDLDTACTRLEQRWNNVFADEQAVKI